jgi:predicted lipid-binding transport protein (Tim44 family)
MRSRLAACLKTSSGIGVVPIARRSQLPVGQNLTVAAQLFDPGNMLLLGIIAIVIWRFAANLGYRNKEPSNWIRNVPESTDSNVGSQPLATVGRSEAELNQLRAAEADFNSEAFLDGAKVAYEQILSAFANGDLSKVKNLLDKNVQNAFASEIGSRKANSPTQKFELVRILNAKILHSQVVGRNVSVTVSFQSEMTYYPVVDNGPQSAGLMNTTREVEDTWTFEKVLRSDNPNWKLIATEDT